MLHYKASLDLFAKIVTVGIILVFVGIGQKNVREIMVGDITQIVSHSLIFMLLLAVIVISYAFAPQSYTLTQTELIINRLIGKVKIKLTDIVGVQKITGKEKYKVIRTFGVGGLFGYFGKFYHFKYGNVTYYTTQHKNMILVKIKKGRKIVVSPDDREMVVKLSGIIKPG